MARRRVRKQELCEGYGVSIRTLNRWMVLGMPYVRPSGGLLLFDPEAVDEWLASRAAGLAPVAVEGPKRGRPRKTGGATR